MTSVFLMVPVSYSALLSVSIACLLAISAIISPSLAEAKQQRVNWQALNLAPEQMASIQSIERDWQSTYARLAPQIVRDQQELRRLLQQPEVNEADVMRLEARIQQNQAILRKKAAITFMQKKRVLSPEQQAMYVQYMNRSSDN